MEWIILCSVGECKGYWVNIFDTIQHISAAAARRPPICYNGREEASRLSKERRRGACRCGPTRSATA